MDLHRHWLVALLALPALAFAEEPSAELLSRLADWVERTEPERVSESMKMSTRSEELDGGGAVRHVNEVVTRVTRGPDRLRIGYGPRGEPDAGIYVGEAKVDAVQGSVLWLRERPSKLPPFVDEIEMELEFNTRSPYGPMLSTMRFRGSGGLPLFKKGGRANIRMSDYVFAPPVKGATP